MRMVLNVREKKLNFKKHQINLEQRNLDGISNLGLR